MFQRERIICYGDNNECDGNPQSAANFAINIMQFNRSLGFFYFIDEQLSVSGRHHSGCVHYGGEQLARLLTTPLPSFQLQII